MLIPISDIKINSGRREATVEQIQELAESIADVGLLNPITVSGDYTLIAGLHRLEAAKILGWIEIECMVCTLDGLKAELAEIDENLVRTSLSTVSYSETLMRRKEIYEALHPETKAGISQAAAMNRAIGNNVSAPGALTSKSFIRDTAEKLGVAPRTVAESIQIAKKLTPEAKEAIQDASVKKKDILKLARLPPEQQEEAASLLVSGGIHSVDEYREKQRAASGSPESEAPPSPEEPSPKPEPPAPETKPVVPDPPFKLPEKRYATFEEGVAALKDMEKDCTCTPDIFLAEFSEFAKRLLQEIECYDIPYYAPAYPGLSRVQLDYLRQQIDAICSALDKYYKSVEVQAI